MKGAHMELLPYYDIDPVFKFHLDGAKGLTSDEKPHRLNSHFLLINNLDID